MNQMKNEVSMWVKEDLVKDDEKAIARIDPTDMKSFVIEENAYKLKRPC